MEQLKSDPANCALRFDLAEALVQSGQHAAAVEHLLVIIAKAPAWGEGQAKALCLRIFESLGPSHPVVTPGRKQLSKLLFR
jgi:putative thioredoxin